MAHIWILICMFSAVYGAEVCFPRLGCFNDNPPWDHVPLPDSPEDIPTEFRLYTKNNKGDDDYELITAEKPGRFNKNHRTFIFLHGWMGSADGGGGLRLKDALLERDDFNVIIVDWSYGASDILYVQTVSNSRIAGAEVAYLISQYQRNLAFDPSLVYLSGFSIGAQAAGQVGKRFNMGNSTRKLGRITGLDPAGPFYDVDDSSAPLIRLYPGDAQFVDTIHTGGWDWLGLGVGLKSGDVDFYPNGGGEQPGCDGNPGCNHQRSFAFFYNSIVSNCTFRAVPCASHEDAEAGRCEVCDPGTNCQYMGWMSENFRERKGIHYLTTLANAPYCKT